LSEVEKAKITRRKYLKYGGGIIAVAVVAAAGYGIYEATKPKAIPKLTLMMFSSPETDWIEKMAQTYREKTGVDITFDVISRETYWDKLDTTLLSKSPEVDIVTMHAPMLGDWAKVGAVEPLSRYLEDSKLFPYDVNSYLPAAIEGAKYKGDVYGLPLWFSTEFMYYRKDLIKDPSRLKTWDGFLETAKEFTKSNNPNSPTDYGTTMYGKKHIEQVMEWVVYYWSFGGRFPTFNSPEAIKALQFYVDLFLKHKVVPPDADTYVWEHTFNAFKFEKVALSINWDANYLANWHETFGDNLGIMPTPAVSGGNPAAYSLTWVIAINAFSKMKEEAFKFISWLTADPDAVHTVSGLGLPVPSTYILAPDVLKAKPHWELMVEYVRKWGFAELAIPGWKKVREILIVHLADAMAGTATPEEALNAAQKEVDAALEG